MRLVSRLLAVVLTAAGFPFIVMGYLLTCVGEWVWKLGE